MTKLDDLADAANGPKRPPRTGEMRTAPATSLPPFPTPREATAKRCCYCFEEIKARATRCPHCQSWLSARLQRRFGAVTRGGVIEALIFWSLIPAFLIAVLFAIGVSKGWLAGW